MPLFATTPYAGQALVLASKHGKQRALARPLRVALGLELLIPADLDTDTLGTFSGEVERLGSAAETCLRKAELGLRLGGGSLSIASEGSFGPHPQIPWMSAGEEILVFLDAGRGLVIQERRLVLRTNFDQRLVGTAEDLADWPARVGFPSHALIVRPHRPLGGASLAATAVRKGLRREAALGAAVRAAAAGSSDGQALVETDMRADRNPTRMAAIRCLAFALVRRIGSLCPACGSPGWGVVESRGGLPCSWCRTPTPLLAFETLGCPACDHRQERPRSDGQSEADPQHCPYCNP
ncbi:MAG: DUF6671 family protein [Cyanobacteria bacterium J06638_7]